MCNRCDVNAHTNFPHHNLNPSFPSLSLHLYPFLPTPVSPLHHPVPSPLPLLLPPSLLPDLLPRSTIARIALALALTAGGFPFLRAGAATAITDDRTVKVLSRVGGGGGWETCRRIPCLQEVRGGWETRRRRSLRRFHFDGC